MCRNRRFSCKQVTLFSPGEMKADKLFFERQAKAGGARVIAGIDEAGRGPLSGPVVAAAVVFPPHQIINGVDDSKKLSSIC